VYISSAQYNTCRFYVFHCYCKWYSCWGLLTKANFFPQDFTQLPSYSEYVSHIPSLQWYTTPTLDFRINEEVVYKKKNSILWIRLIHKKYYLPIYIYFSSNKFKDKSLLYVFWAYTTIPKSRVHILCTL